MKTLDIPLYELKSKANNTTGLLAVRFLAAFSQPTHIVVSYLQLIHDPLVSLTDFLGSCAQAGCKLTARFSSLSSPLSSTSAFSRLTACYYTCSESNGHTAPAWTPRQTAANSKEPSCNGRQTACTTALSLSLSDLTHAAPKVFLTKNFLLSSQNCWLNKFSNRAPLASNFGS